MVTKAEQIQRDYYARTSHAYTTMHEGQRSAHDVALDTLAGLLPAMDARSFLDVGPGAGRALKVLGSRLPDLQLAGVEPVPELIAEAERAGIAPGTIRRASGTALPFADQSFDVAACFGVLHHVPDPRLVLAEMLRVSRKAIFFSDGNRFAQGRPVARYLKLALHATRLWPAFNFIRTRGRGYSVSEGDGLFYSFSVFDSLPFLRERASRLMLIELETAKTPAGIWSMPLTNADSMMVGVIK